MEVCRHISTAGFILGVISCAPVQLAEPEPVAATYAKPSARLPMTSEMVVEEKDAQAGPAGIVLYCHHRGEVHLLLANDRFGKRGWGGFVGGEKKGETAAMTAARETHEETRGYYDSMKLFRMIADQKPVRLWGCHWYIAEVAHVPAKAIMEHPIPLLRPAYMETQHYAWIPFSEIEPLLTKQSPTAADLRLNRRYLQPNSRSDSYWRSWVSNMRQMHLKDAFPWSR